MRKPPSPPTCGRCSSDRRAVCSLAAWCRFTGSSSRRSRRRTGRAQRGDHAHARRANAAYIVSRRAMRVRAGTGVDAFLDRSTTPWTLRDAFAGGRVCRRTSQCPAASSRSTSESSFPARADRSRRTSRQFARRVRRQDDAAQLHLHALQRYRRLHRDQQQIRAARSTSWTPNTLRWSEISSTRPTIRLPCCAPTARNSGRTQRSGRSDRDGVHDRARARRIRNLVAARPTATTTSTAISSSSSRRTGASPTWSTRPAGIRAASWPKRVGRGHGQQSVRTLQALADRERGRAVRRQSVCRDRHAGNRALLPDHDRRRRSASWLSAGCSGQAPARAGGTPPPVHGSTA